MVRASLLLLLANLSFAQTNVVISQIYGGGGNAGAPLRNDFIELFNRGSAPVDLTGWSVQYGSAGGTDWQATPISGTIQPGRYYLVQEAAGANTAAAALPAPDATGEIPMSSSAGRVRIVNAASAELELVAYSGLANTTAYVRRAAGCGTDFQVAAPAPRNSASSATDCNAAPEPPLSLKISEIQGSGPESPYKARSVTTRGIVTGRKSNGFFIQSAPADADNDPATSEGVFVFTQSAPPTTAAVSNLVEVTGTVQEFRPASDPQSGPLTELIAPSVTVIQTGQSLPAAVTLAWTGDWERYEGMRVSMPSAVSTSGTLGSVDERNATATSNGVFYVAETGLARPFSSPIGDVGPRLLRIDTQGLGGSGALDASSGSLVQNLVGPLDFASNTYTIDTERPPALFSPTPAAPIIPRSSGEFAVASMNLQRFFDDVDDPNTSDAVLTTAAFQRRTMRTARVIRNVLGLPEIIGVVEVENYAALEALARATGDYLPYLAEGNDIGGIDVGFLVRRDRVTVQSVAQEGKDARIGTDILNDRPPLILRATVDGLPVVVVVNHLRSLINADTPTVAAKRRMQSEFLRDLLAKDASANLISIGDYNMDQFDPLMQIIKTPDLINLTDTLKLNEGYTYVHDGVIQTLDHVLVSRPAFSHVTRYQVVHINADNPETTRNQEAGSERISDHDFPIAYFSAQTPTVRPIGVTNAATFLSGSVSQGEWLAVFTGLTQMAMVAPSNFSGTVDVNGTPVAMPVAPSVPGIFTSAFNGRGQGAILNQDLSMNSASNPAMKASIVAIYGTGLQTTNNAVWIGNTRAEVTFAGQAPGLPAGIQQVNARIPEDAPAGDVPIFITSGSGISAPYVTVAIR